MYTKVAIYGGAFNPPTLGHLHVIKEIFANTNIEKIILVPDGLRVDKKYNISGFHREKLIQIFAEELNNLGLNIEIDYHFLKGINNSNTTTYQVDKYFTDKLNSQPWHVFGTDVSNGIKNWSGNPNKFIQKKLKKIFVPRKGCKFYDFDLENYKLINITVESSISSTQIKENISKSYKIDNLTFKKINEYINKNKLY